jgi:hypothetical protein
MSKSNLMISSIRRVGWGMGDQALSSATNFAVGVFVARNVSGGDFGAFGLVFSTYLLLLGLTRAFATEPLLVRYSHKGQGEWEQGSRAALGVALVAGVGMGALGIVVGLVAQGALGFGLVALGLTLPGLLIQDSLRMAFFAAGRGSLAFANDTVWALALMVGFFTLDVADLAGVGWYTAAWGLGACVAVLFGFLQANLKPNPSMLLGWWRAQRDLVSRYVSEFVVRSGGTQLITYAVGGIVSFAAVGALRAGQILLGPFNILFQGIWLIAVPEQVRLLRRGTNELRRSAIALSAVLAALALGYGFAARLLPSTIGRALLGASWAGAQDVILPLALSMSGLGIVMGASSALRALEAAVRGLQARVVTTILLVVGGLSGAIVAGAVGTASGMAAGYWIGAGVWWWHLVKALREHDARAKGSTGASSEEEVGRALLSAQ